MRQNTDRATVTTVLRRLFEGFDSTGVTWALLRGREGMGSAGRDVDLLVAEEDLGRAEDVVFALGGVALPRPLHPWHRFYVLPDPASGQRLELDVVTELIYHREQRLRSGLEGPLLERRVREDPVYVLDPTDRFWTVLLHCLLDKQAFNQRRRTELTGALPAVGTPSPAEAFFQSQCPPGWSSARAVERVRAGDWPSLVVLGRVMASGIGAASPVTGTGHASPAARAVRSLVAAQNRSARWGRRAVAAVYPSVWRSVGLGACPLAMDLAEKDAVDVLVVRLRRRPALLEAELLVDDGEYERLVSALRQARYRRGGGAWNRLTRSGLERVWVTAPAQRGMTQTGWRELRSSSRPMYRRQHCRRAARTQSDT